MQKTNRERLTEIATTFASYGFGHLYRIYLQSENQEGDAEKFRKAFEDLGPSFIKIGQILSTRGDLLPPAYIKELQKLQDDSPPFSYEEAERIFYEDFGEEIEDAFAYVDKKPLASASVAQVHRGQLKDGREIIIKVQRPEIEENLLRDIRLFGRVFSAAPEALRNMFIDTEAALEEIQISTRQELDFKNEAEISLRFIENNKDLPVVNAPKPYMEYTSQRILVQEYVDGIPRMNREKLIDAGYDPVDVGQKLLMSFLTQIFRDGLYHGDPHPGNLFVKDRQIYYIDFGLYGELTENDQKLFIDLLKVIVQEDIEGLMKIILSLAVTKKKVDQVELYSDVQYLFLTYFNKSVSDISLEDGINEILHVMRKHGMVFPHDFVTLLRALFVIEGVVEDLSPDISISEIIKGYIRNSDDIEWIEIPSKERLLIKTYKTLEDLSELPSDFKTLLDNIREGRLTVNLSLIDKSGRWVEVNKMINRLIFALVLSALILASAIIIAMGAGTGISIIAVIIFIVAGFIGLWLLISIFRSGML